MQRPNTITQTRIRRGNLLKVYEGRLNGAGLKVAIVVSRFNDFITSRLLDGALDTLRRHDVAISDVEVAWTPGCLEIPVVAKSFAASGRFQAVIALGAVIRGATPHFDYVASESAKGLATITLDSGVPVINGILTTDSIEQAVERAGTKAGNKGSSSAMSAIEMGNLLKELG